MQSGWCRLFQTLLGPFALLFQLISEPRLSSKATEPAEPPDWKPKLEVVNAGANFNPDHVSRRFSFPTKF